MDRQRNHGFAPWPICRISQTQRTAVRFGNLPAEHQADAGTAALGGEERHE
jgi:hypothetical protein